MSGSEDGGLINQEAEQSSDGSGSSSDESAEEGVYLILFCVFDLCCLV